MLGRRRHSGQRDSTVGAVPREVSRFWDLTPFDGLIDMATHVGAPSRPLEIAPQGFGRPWYPLYKGLAIVEAEYDRPILEDGTRDLIVNYKFRYVEGPVKTRVGFRRWVKGRMPWVRGRGEITP